MKKRYIAYIILASFISVINVIFLQIPYSEDYNIPFKDTNIKIGASDITIMTPENSTYTAPMSGYYPATYGFEEDAIGATDLNIGWVDDKEPTASAEIIGSIVGHENVLNYTCTVDHDGIWNFFPISRASGTLELYVYLQETNIRHTILLKDDSGGRIILDWYDDGLLKWYDDPTWYTIESYNANQWYHIKIEFDCADDWHLWIDGVSKDGGAGYTYDQISPSTMDSMILQGTSGCGMYIDAIGYSWDPDYTIGDNLNQGLLLSFDSSFIPDWTGYSLDGQANITILGNTTFPMPNDGLHSIQVSSNNTGGTMYQSDIRYFTVDTTPPQLSITYPTTGAEFSNPPSFILSITEENIASIWYTLNGGPNIPFTGTSGVIDSTAWNALPNGPITIRFYIRDIVDSEDFDEVIVIKTTSQEIPPVIPGYNILILIGISCVIIGVSAKRKLKF